MTGRPPDGPSSEGSPSSSGGGWTWGLIGLTVVIAAVSVRASHLYWSPLPSTLDGFFYVADTTSLLQQNALPTPIAWDTIGFTAVVGVTSAVFGVAPLYLMQPLTAAIGGFSCLIGVVLVRRIAESRNWSLRRAYLGAGVAGLGLAVDGLYSRRTGVPDEEVVTLLLIPLLALAAYRAMARKSWAWTAVSLIVALVLPPVHSFSALIAALTVTAVVVALVDARQDRRSATIGGVLLIVVWGSILGYYRLVQSIPELTLVYTDRLLSAPGVFVAWVILLVVGVVALAGSSGLTQRVVVGVLLLGQFVLFVVNAVQPVFPGTQPSTQIVLISAFPLVGIATLATWALPIGASRQHDGAVAAAIVAGPLVMILYALTAGLTPEYYSIVLRAQTFEHVGVLVLGGVGTVMVADAVQSRLTGHYPAGSSVVRLAVVIIVLLSVAASAPLAVATLDTGEIPTTTTPAEFAATGTAAERLPSPWASDHPFSRLGTFHGADTTTAPVRSWIRSGVPPTCPTVYRPSWVSHGANLFPASAGRLSAGSFSSWQGRNDHVYRAVGVDDAGIVVSPAGPKSC